MNRQAKQLKESHELAKQHQRQWLLLPAAACLLPACCVWQLLLLHAQYVPSLFVAFCLLLPLPLLTPALSVLQWRLGRCGPPCGSMCRKNNKKKSAKLEEIASF